MKLRPLLTEIKLDSLPILIDFKRYLEHLSINETSMFSNGCASKTESCLIETIPEIRESFKQK